MLYVKEKDLYVCPDSIPMYYKTITKQGYREYVSKKEHC